MPLSSKPAVRRALTATALAAAAALGATMHRARYRNPYAVKLESVVIGDERDSGETVPLRIAFVTDTHVGPAISAAYVDRAMQLVMDEEPDLLLLGGDFVCESPRYIADAAAVVGAYAERARLGAFAVLGNHDYSNDAPRLAAHLERKGIHVLRNEAAPVPESDGKYWIVGVDDAILSRPDPDAAFAPVPASATALALWHEPDWAEESAAHGAIAQLSGHSHGGQVRLPIVGHVAAPAGGKRYVSGMNWANGMPIYTSRGVGVYRPPVRLRCSPEVTLVSLWPKGTRATDPDSDTGECDSLQDMVKETVRT